jgi:nicotinate-nucleotide pyrophosphorylase (carboxylating)
MARNQLGVVRADNHVWAAGSITNAVKAARKAGGFSIKIEVEARNLEEATEAVRGRRKLLIGSDYILSICVVQAAAGADIVMFDNYTPEALAVDAKILKEKFPHVIAEGSGVRGAPKLGMLSSSKLCT